MADIVYLRMHKKVNIAHKKQLYLEDIAHISSNVSYKKKLELTPIYRITEKDKNILIIDSFLIVDHLISIFPNIEIQLLGYEQTIIHIQNRKKQTNLWIVSFVWLLLFVGTAMTIMNFHYDVSMQQVHQKIYLLLTGVGNEFPLWIQIPYSLGLGVGTLLFFNHWFNKRFNEEPSPLEIEIFNYQQDINQYITYMENDLNDPRNSS
ncbi:stage V sporulation protein AA [Oceanobacillus iheyensis]|uniref:Stage V sporulation protein AA n=1 Tax=Oceanobacillus iheyensis (strain DSM 14371 / CIP 107618 / JCM 11309 / KCTC 3954 / HTE831) TaxID=221109 RepID=Q8EQ77_OCEIH|nr:stage V sporulation protein AA [Oceanobacillus iheyensis]BAC13792.1 stage V sporulation protein AA [Oceanobacillus iheyensis HTE831]